VFTSNEGDLIYIYIYIYIYISDDQSRCMDTNEQRSK
jgi:hypothetical protein